MDQNPGPGPISDPTNANDEPILGEFEEVAQLSPPTPLQRAQLPIKIEPALAETAEAAGSLQTLFYFLVGGTLVGQDVLIGYLRAWGLLPKAEENSLMDKLQQASIGLFGLGVSFTQQTVSTTAEYAAGWWRWGQARAERARAESPSRFQGPAEFMLGLGDAALTRLAERGKSESQASRAAIEKAMAGVVDDLLAYIAQRPGLTALVVSQAQQVLPQIATDEMVTQLVDAQVEMLLNKLATDPALGLLIEQQADQYLAEVAHSENLDLLVNTQANRLIDELIANTTVQAMVRNQADQYLDYLQDENQAQVQELVQGQSLGLANEVMDEIREKTVTADTLVERAIRRILRRKPREKLDPPSETLRQRAIHQRLQK